jgi:hypothetical protein
MERWLCRPPRINYYYMKLCIDKDVKIITVASGDESVTWDKIFFLCVQFWSCDVHMI